VCLILTNILEINIFTEHHHSCFILRKGQMKFKLLQYILFTLIFFNITYANNINKNVTLQLSWFDQFQFAGYYMAKEKGFYKDLGLNVDIKAFGFDKNIPYDINIGKYDFAVGRETLILEKSNNQLVSLFALFQASPLILISTEESGINSISAFNNKRIMTTIDDASEVSIKAMINSQKIEMKNLNFIKHTHDINDLIKNHTDIISAYSSKSPFYLQKMGIKYNIFSPKDYGFDMYSDFLYTNKNKVQNDLETVLKFKKASLRGWEYAYSNIEETVDLILKKYNTQNLTKDELVFEANELKKLSYYQTDNLGEIDLSKLQRIYDLYNVLGLVENKINIKDFIYVENNFSSLLKNLKKIVNKYIELPYIYFFISLFFILISLIIYKHIILHITTKKLILKEEQFIKINEELKELAEKDFLSKLYNRRSFENISKELLYLAKRESTNTCLVMIDIDRFKNVNDTYGHQIGDYVLSSLSELMNQYKRASDVIARYGGEEFVILLPKTSREGAIIYSENLRKKIESSDIKIDNLTLNITVSMGLTLFKENESIYSAINRADEGLYLSKRNRRNQVTAKM
jgi:diguanylate cyclase (GGDEF)-like protein